jgi:regulatory protein
MSSSRFEEAYQYALKLLAIHKRTARQLARKLADKGFDRKTAQGVLTNLEGSKLLDDEEFALTFVSDRMAARPQGRFKLRYELERKGVPREILSRALATVDENYELAAAKKLALEKARLLSGMEPLRRQKKVYDFLRRRGFQLSACRAAARAV